jgi:hypothetical protein
MSRSEIKNSLRLFLVTVVVSTTIAACQPGPTVSPDASVPPTPITSPVPDRATATPESTATQQATATARPTETEAPYIFEVTAEKLSHTPPDYDYLVAHPDEFVHGISPWDYGMEEFYRWVDEELDPVLGDLVVRDQNLNPVSGDITERMPNVIIDFDTTGPERDYFDAAPKKQELPIGKFQFFYFIHNGIYYPVYIVNAQMRGT